LAKIGRSLQTNKTAVTMNSSETQALRTILIYQPAPRRLAQSVAQEVRPPYGETLSEPPLWKLTSTVCSPLKPEIETGLFLIIGALGVGMTAYSWQQVVNFFHDDTFVQAVTSLLR
jgi:hypothetical protein